MLSVENLKALGVNTEEGIARCIGKPEFYLKMVKAALNDDGFDKLEAAVAAGNYDEAFAAAHNLKGVAANLALTPLNEPLKELTDLLRPRVPVDCSNLLAECREQYAKLKALCE